MALKLPTDKIDRRRQRDGLMPNVIHSFDASNIVKTVDLLKTNQVEIFTIHDCFASHAANVATVQREVKRGFISLYVNENRIAALHNDWLNALANQDPSRITVDRDKGLVYIDKKEHKIPTVPPMGKLDISEIEKSKYMVH